MTIAPPPLLPGPAIYGTLVGEINQVSARAVTNALTLATQQNAAHVHILIQSTGGTVSEGVYLYNFLQALSLPVTTYNVGSVCSAAVLAFLGAKTRVCSKHASFMIHRPQSPPAASDLSLLAAATASLKVDDARLDAILQAHLTLSRAKWRKYGRHPLWIDAKEAVKAGLATTIGDFAPPTGAPIFLFG